MDENLSFDEFLNSMLGGEGAGSENEETERAKDSENEETERAELLKINADLTKGELDAFMNAGFTREEAFKLVAIFVYASLTD